MLCCAVGVAAVATGAIGWRRFRRFLCERPTARSMLSATAVALIVLTAGGVAAAHFFDHTAHAAGGPALPAGPLPLCTGPAADNEKTRE